MHDIEKKQIQAVAAILSVVGETPDVKAVTLELFLMETTGVAPHQLGRFWEGAAKNDLLRVDRDGTVKLGKNGEKLAKFLGVVLENAEKEKHTTPAGQPLTIDSA